MKRIARALLALLAMSPVIASAQAAKPCDIEAFIRKQKFEDIKISPTGEYYAATVRIERKTAVAILRRSDNKLIRSASASTAQVTAATPP